jgi:hypothetical protein
MTWCLLQDTDNFTSSPFTHSDSCPISIYSRLQTYPLYIRSTYLKAAVSKNIRVTDRVRIGNFIFEQPLRQNSDFVGYSFLSLFCLTLAWAKRGEFAKCGSERLERTQISSVARNSSHARRFTGGFWIGCFVFWM